MFRIQRKRVPWIALGLVLGLLLLPLPATAGSFWEGAGAQKSWEGMWAGLLKWLGLTVVETSSIYIDPNGQPTPPGTAGSGSSSSIDPNGQPPLPGSSSSIDPLGQP